MKRIIGVLMLFCIILSANAQLLWKVSGKGLEKPSYIMGTHHLAPLSVLDNVKGYQAAFDATSQVIGEVVMADVMSQEGMQTMMSMMTIQGDTTLQMLFTPEQFDLVNTFTKENLQMDINMANKLKPAFIATTIVGVIYSKHVGEYNPNEQLDSHFQKMGAENGKKIAGLETIAFQYDMLFNKTPLQRQAESLVCTLSDIDKTIDATKKLSEAYMGQDLTKMYELSIAKEGTVCDMLPYEWNNLVDSRNDTWVELLPALMKEEPSFVVVGALHMPGPNGILNLLKEQGYTVEPVKE